MNWRLGMRALLVAGVAVTIWPSASKALEPIDFSLSASPSDSAAAPRTAAAADEEDAFFSSGIKKRDTTGTVTVAGPMPRPVAVPRPTVDVIATCRAVLADNLNYYNYNFIEGCKRSVRHAVFARP